MTEEPILLIKYGGNAMRDAEQQEAVVRTIANLKEQGVRPVLVHGGGPFIQKFLDRVGLASEFIDGHRKTTLEALPFVEMALKGQVNGTLVRLFNALGVKAVGLSGKDGGLIRAKQRGDGSLGFVGEVAEVQPGLIFDLLKKGYLPVITCIASDKTGQDYNINADLLAGALAGALRAYYFVLLTDVDGLYRDFGKPESLIRELSLTEVADLYGDVITGGMIPKMESCQIALNTGAQTAAILNGANPERLVELIHKQRPLGTHIRRRTIKTAIDHV